jgi:hypothetical protein
MPNKNEDIHLFILDEDRKKNTLAQTRENVLREWLQGPTEQLVTPPQNAFGIHEELCKEETISLGERNQPASEKQESDLRVTEHVEIGSAPETNNVVEVVEQEKLAHDIVEVHNTNTIARPTASCSLCWLLLFCIEDRDGTLVDSWGHAAFRRRTGDIECSSCSANYSVRSLLHNLPFTSK